MIFGCDDDDRVVAGVMLVEIVDHTRDGRASLADGAVNAQHALVALVDDRVQGDCRLASLSVAKDQLALSATDGNQGVHDFDAGLQGHGDRCAIHDRGCRPFDRQAASGVDRAESIDGPADAIDNATQ